MRSVEYPSLVLEAYNMDELSKMYYYILYCTHIRTINYGFDFSVKEEAYSRNKSSWNYMYGTRKVDRETKFLNYYYPDKQIPIVSFQEFCDIKSVSILDNGEDWNKMGRASRFRFEEKFESLYWWHIHNE